MNTLTLAHYYTTPEIQNMADFVGDSLELSLIAQREKADRIVFAGVKFMAETAKILNPDAEVILPDEGSTCSLVTQTDPMELSKWDTRHRMSVVANGGKPEDVTHVMYINSSVVMKSFADIIVTSRNVDDIVKAEFDKGNKVIFSPDRNMGAYLNYQYGYNMPVWNAVCEVHDQFKEDEILELKEATESHGHRFFLIAHPESPLPVLKMADFIGSTSKMLKWVEDFDGDTGNDFIFVATEDGLLYNMSEARPDLNIAQAPIYSGCQCNSCPYMKKNTVGRVKRAQQGKGLVIDYISDKMAEKARQPIERMLNFY